jgi:WD40 repeat protein
MAELGEGSHIFQFASEARCGSTLGANSNIVCLESEVFFAAKTDLYRIPLAALRVEGATSFRRNDPPLAVYPECKGPPALAISKDGTLLVSAHWHGNSPPINTLRLWNSRTGEQLRSWTAHRGLIYSVDFSPDGSRIVTGSDDRTLGIHDVERGEQVLELRGHMGYVHSVAFSPDGTQIASGSGDHTVRIWNSIPGYLRARSPAAATAR